MTDVSSRERQRIDKWLWHARVVKTRTLAQRIVAGGKVRVNRGKIVAASSPVKPGDVLTIALPKRVLVLRIVAFSERRGAAVLAQTLYENLTPPVAVDRQPAAPVHPGGGSMGRPGKRDRRKLLELKNIDVS